MLVLFSDSVQQKSWLESRITYQTVDGETGQLIPTKLMRHLTGTTYKFVQVFCTKFASKNHEKNPSNILVLDHYSLFDFSMTISDSFVRGCNSRVRTWHDQNTTQSNIYSANILPQTMVLLFCINQWDIRPWHDMRACLLTTSFQRLNVISCDWTTETDSSQQRTRKSRVNRYISSIFDSC